jgi:hypothetical protein
MLNRSCCAVAHAHPEGAPAHHAQVAVAALSVMLTQSGRWRVWLFLLPRAFCFPPRWPNTPIQPTPLAASEIGAILTVRICYNAITPYRCGAADGQPVGWRINAIFCFSSLFPIL